MTATLPQKLSIAAALLAILFSGCAGANAVRIHSDPEGAKLYVNGRYVGLTPQIVPAHWTVAGLQGAGETLRVELVKDGYRSRNETITFNDLVARYNARQFEPNSKYGATPFSNTYDFRYPLERAPAASPTRVSSVPRKSPKPSPQASPKKESWR